MTPPHFSTAVYSKKVEADLIRLAAIVESSDDAIMGKDLNGIVTSWNKGAETIFGYTAEEMVGASIMRLIPDDRREEESEVLEKIHRGESLDNLETVRQTKGGKLISVSVTISPIKDINGKVIGVSKVVHDITVRKGQEWEIERLSRLYAALSHVNQTIVTLNNREELFAKICRGLVEIGKLRMAWVGWLDVKTRQVVPVAQCGDDINYLSQVTIYADDRPEGQGPTGTAVREERNYICNDFSHDPRTLLWRKMAEQGGFQSSASLLIRQGGAICGAITVYAGQVDFFQDKEIALLEEAAADISFALDNFVREEARRQAEVELRWKTAFLEAQVDSSIDGILVVDDQGTKILQNQRMNDLWKIPPEISGNMDDSVQIRFVTGRTKNPRQFADRIIHLNSHPDEVSRDEIELTDGTFLDRYSASVSDKGGKHYGRIWTFRDMTERKRTETALLESKRFLRSTLDALSAHIAILDEHGTIIAVNAAWKHFASENHFMGSECGVGKNYLQVCDAAAGRFSEEAPAAASGIRAIIAGQRDVFNLEYPCHSPPEKRWFVVHATRFIGDGPVRVVVAHENISERKRIEMRFRRLVDSNAQGVIFWNTKGEITESNDAFLNLIGYTRADLEAGLINWMKLTPPEFAQLDRHCLEEIVAVGVCKPFEKEYISKDGKHVPILIGAAAFEDNPEEGLCFVFDLTERKKLEGQFRQSQKMEGIGQLAGGVAHDFNNILAVIQMQADLLKTEAGITPAQLETAVEIGSAVQRASALTRQLLLFSRKETLQPRDLDLNESINELTKMLRRTLGDNIQLQFKFAMQPIFVRADAGMMDQVLMNLALNARDAMPKGGKLVIETSAVEFDEAAASHSGQIRPGKFVCLSVSDTGCGIPPENLQRIFEPFFTTKDVGKGTGLGLATVFGIVQQHNGWIDVNSEVGHGTTFRIYLPHIAKTSDQKFVQPATEQARGGNETILLVEDEPRLRASVKNVLSRLGYNVLESSDGASALKVWKKHRNEVHFTQKVWNQKRDEIHLLLTDMVMPGGMTGKDLGEQLLKENPGLKVIYVSGYSAEVAGRDFPLKEGVNFLIKPFQAQKLAQTVRQMLDAGKVS
jgi:PAS domain S-box-containing protein